MQSYGSCILVYSIITLHFASAAITRLSSVNPAQLAKNQTITKQFKSPRRTFDSMFTKTDENDEYADESVRIFKRDTNYDKFQAFLKSVMPVAKPKLATKRPKKTGDFVFDVIRDMIEEEKERKRFDLVDPPNSKSMHQEQRIWDKIRIKAAGDLLLHPKRRFPSFTERVFDYFKEGVVEITEPPVKEELFAPLKEKQEKRFYLKIFDEMFGVTATPKTFDRMAE